MIYNPLFESFLLCFLGRLSIYCPYSVSLSFRVPNIAISEFRTRTSGLFCSVMTLFVGLIFPTVLPGARTSYSPSKIYFCLCVACILRAIFTCTLHSPHGIGLEILFDHMKRDSPSFVFSALHGRGRLLHISPSQFQRPNTCVYPPIVFLCGMTYPGWYLHRFPCRLCTRLLLPIYLGVYMATKCSVLGTTLQSFQYGLEWMSCSAASLIALGIAILSSMHRQPFFKLKSRQYE